MSRLAPQTRIYVSARPMSPADRASQIRHLALIGLAATGSELNLRDHAPAFVSLFEVIHRLADELEDEMEGAA